MGQSAGQRGAEVEKTEAGRRAEGGRLADELAHSCVCCRTIDMEEVGKRFTLDVIGLFACGYDLKTLR